MKTIFAPKAVIEKWLSALRSGEYVQGRGKLYNNVDNSYCCLGVLQHCLDGKAESSHMPSFEWLQAHGIIFHEGASLNTVSPTLPTLGRSAWAANDIWNYRFSEIADAIEACAEYTDEVGHEKTVCQRVHGPKGYSLLRRQVG